MTTRRWGRRRRVARLLGASAVTVALTGCTGAVGSDTSTAMPSLAPLASSPIPGGTAAGAGKENPTREVSCDVHTCTLTLRTSYPREVRAFGATLLLAGVENGSASLIVGDGRVECTADESVEAGPLTLFCDDVTADSVTLTAEVG